VGLVSITEKKNKNKFKFVFTDGSCADSSVGRASVTTIKGVRVESESLSE